MTQSAARARAEIISGCRELKLSSRVLIASGAAARGNPHGELGTAGLFQGGTSSSNPLSSTGEVCELSASLSPGRFSHAIPEAAKKTIIHCNIDELHINKMYPTAHAVIGDALDLAGAPAGSVRPHVRCRTDGG
jgi:hypothetical protein